jgi:hypothetical protein
MLQQLDHRIGGGTVIFEKKNGGPTVTGRGRRSECVRRVLVSCFHTLQIIVGFREARIKRECCVDDRANTFRAARNSACKANTDLEKYRTHRQ